MIAIIIIVIMLLVVVPAVRKRRLRRLPLRSPIEPGGVRPALPAMEPKKPSAPQPALRDGKATVETLMDDYAEGRISVEEYEDRLDQLYKKGKT